MGDSRAKDVSGRIRSLERELSVKSSSDIAIADSDGALVSDTKRGPDRRAGRVILRLRPAQKITGSSLKLQNLEFLGKGGSGSVFRMMITEGDLKGLFVAVKFLEAVQDEKRVKRFEEEIKILQDIAHPHVVKILDLGSFGTLQRDIRFFVMEYHPRNLQREIQAHPRGLHPDIALPLCMQIASALTAVHSKGIIHRDLKPSNILFDGTNIKIADFGIARRNDTDGDESVRVTSSGEKVAPHYHMSPEQWQWWKGSTENPPGPESDVYQFGLIMYQLMTGFNPNIVNTWNNEGIRQETTSKVFIGGGSLVNDIAYLVREMLSETPTQRPTVDDVQERLLGLFRSYSSHYAALYGVQPGREY